jgi:hypothetical protein
MTSLTSDRRSAAMLAAFATSFALLTTAPRAAAEPPTAPASATPAATAAPAAPAPLAPRADAVDATEAPRSNVPAYVAFGLAGAGVVVGTVFGVSALGPYNDYQKAPTAESARRAERYALVADVAFGAAFAAGVTGAVLLVSNLGHKPAAEAPARSSFVAPFAGPSGGGAVAVMTF